LSDLIQRIESAAALYEGAVLARHTELGLAHHNSEKKLTEVQEHLRNHPPAAALGMDVLAVAGSLARLEASSLSDIDLIITTTSEPDDAAATAIVEWRKELCEALGIDAPNPHGVFHQPISRSSVVSIAGASDERYDHTSKRILFLLESAPLSDKAEYDALLDAVIDRYAEDVVKDPTKNFVFLLNDVVRYFRLLCVNYQQVKTETPDGKWPLRNVKLRHSRVLMYFSMIAALGLLSRERGADKVDALKLLVRMHPLKRLFVAYQMADDSCFYRVAGLYDTFIALLSKKKTRAALLAVDYETRYESSVFSQLKANSDAFAAELMRFYNARRNYWDERFFEYMIL
jgi:predicted nucleotidyltransferase